MLKLQAFEDGTLPEDDLEEGDDWEYVEENSSHQLNGDAHGKGVPLAEVAGQVFQEHSNQASFTDADTSASDKSQAGSSSFSDIELTSSSDSDSSESDVQREGC